MRKFAIALTVLILSLGATGAYFYYIRVFKPSSSQASTQEQNSDSTSYESDTFPVGFKYPADLTLREGEREVELISEDKIKIKFELGKLSATQTIASVAESEKNDLVQDGVEMGIERIGTRSGLSFSAGETNYAYYPIYEADYVKISYEAADTSLSSVINSVEFYPQAILQVRAVPQN